MTSLNPLASSWKEQDWTALIHRASTLYERLKGPGVPELNPSDAARIDARLQSWCKSCAAGDPERFAKRLEQLAHTEQTIRPYLGSKTPRPAAELNGKMSLPSWANLLRDFMDWLPRRVSPPLPTEAFLDDTEPVAFEHLLAPFVEFARLRLASQDKPGFSLLSQKTEQHFSRHLLKLLSHVAAGPLFLEFSLFRLCRPAAGIRDSGNPAASPVEERTTHAIYRLFCQSLLDNALVGFFLEYSFLARRVATILECWLESTREFLRRLSADLPELEAQFNEGKPLGKVAQARPGLSDRHHRGRTVMVIRFENGPRVVYKPKDMGLEHAFFEFLRSYADSPGERDALGSWRALRTLLRQDYGWVEYAEDNPCDDACQIPHFYRRSGRLMGLLFGLNGTDFHSENLVAFGQHPVAVDLETLLNPDMRYVEDSEAEGRKTVDGAGRAIATVEPLFTVLNCGFLPFWAMGPNQQLVDQSGFGGFQDLPASFQTRGFRSINTDQMEIVLHPIEMEKPKNLPHLNESPVRADDFVNDIVRGFEESYRFWLSLRDRSPRDRRIRDCFGRLGTRHVFRHTRIYATLLEQTNRVECQREAVDASLIWDGMSRAFRNLKFDHPLLALLEAEHRALACDDIPVFYANTNSRSLTIQGGPRLRNHFRRSGWNTFRRHLRSMNPADMERQSSLIRLCFDARRAGPLDSTGHEPFITGPGVSAGCSEFDDTRLSEIAVSIAKRIQAGAFPDGAGNLLWFGLSPDPAIKRYAAGMLGTAFYQGQGGIAVFLAAMERALPGQGFGNGALGALRMPSEDLRILGRPADTGEPINLGGMGGVGSLIYSFLKTGLLLGRESLIDDAAKLAASITESMIESDTVLDVMGGTAGAILALLALHQHTGADDVLGKATRCGRHLLKRRMPDAAGLRAWPTIERRLLTGFSHGAAGISYALCKLFEQTGLPEFREGALEGVAYERQVFVPEQSNWPDFRFSTQNPAFPNQWCHGATGIGYSRLGMMTAIPESAPEIAIAVKLTLAQPLNQIDHLCCGNAGQISFLFDAARCMQRPDWESAARGRLGRFLAVRESEKAFRYFATLPSEVFHPGFMQGAAGIGYTLLRLARPDLQLPCCLLLE